MPFPQFWRRAPATPIREQIDPAACEDWSRSVSGTEEDRYWHQLAVGWSQKDPQSSNYLELHNACYEAYNANPLAFAIIEMTTSFVLGKGITVAASQPEVQRVLTRFWNDPDNHMETRIYSLCTELSLYGEQFIRFYVNSIDGSVKIRQLDPAIIDQIETDPDDIETIRRFHLRALDEQAGTDGEWLQAGSEVLQFCINKVSNARRGKSDLATLLPWLRRYKDWLTDRVRVNKYKGAFLWDVEMRGADRKALDLKRMEYAYPPEPGTVIIHNESEQWTAVKPEISAGDVAEDGRALKLMIAAGAQIPEHYLSDGSNGNRATAAEMGLPTMLRFQRRQYVLRAMLRAVLDRVVLEARRAKVLSATIDSSYELHFPEIDVDDHQTLAGATQMLVSALSVARQQGWVSDETAMRLLFQCMGEEIDVHEELRRVQQMRKEEPGAS